MVNTRGPFGFSYCQIVYYWYFWEIPFIIEGSPCAFTILGDYGVQRREQEERRHVHIASNAGVAQVRREQVVSGKYRGVV